MSLFYRYFNGVCSKELGSIDSLCTWEKLEGRKWNTRAVKKNLYFRNRKFTSISEVWRRLGTEKLDLIGNSLGLPQVLFHITKELVKNGFFWKWFKLVKNHSVVLFFTFDFIDTNGIQICKLNNHKKYSIIFQIGNQNLR